HYRNDNSIVSGQDDVDLVRSIDSHKYLPLHCGRGDRSRESRSSIRRTTKEDAWNPRVAVKPSHINPGVEIHRNLGKARGATGTARKVHGRGKSDAAVGRFTEEHGKNSRDVD